MSMLDLIHDKREAILALGAEYGISNIRVFGSVARGDDGPDSDIDFLVDYTTPLNPQRKGLAALDFDDKLKMLLNRNVDVVCEAYLKPHYLRFILPEAKTI